MFDLNGIPYRRRYIYKFQPPRHVKIASPSLHSPWESSALPPVDPSTREPRPRNRKRP